MTFLANLLLFINTLRRAGLSVSTEQSMEVARALEMIEIGEREQVYHASRSLLVKRREEIATFDVIFNRFWRIPGPELPTQKTPQAPRHTPPQTQRATIVTLMASRAKPGDEEVDVADKSGTGSNIELIQHKAFGGMTGEELEQIKRLIEQMRWEVSLRQSRRRMPDRHGDTLHLRQLLHSAARHAGTPLMLTWQRRKIKRRPLVVLADISGSMEKYSRLLLQFAFVLTQSLGGYGSIGVESFAFGTRLTRLTDSMKLRNIDVAIQEAAGEVRDWAGGTRIGDALHRFNIEYARRLLRRGAVVLIVSDGCDCGDIELLRTEMRYLHNRCHTLIWLNPLAGDPRYQPLVAGMAAAMPFIDEFLPIHNLQSLQQLAKKLVEIRD